MEKQIDSSPGSGKPLALSSEKRNPVIRLSFLQHKKEFGKCAILNCLCNATKRNQRTVWLT
jgi:hypothetical protein